MKVLIVSATNFEIQPFVKHITQHSHIDDVDIFHYKDYEITFCYTGIGAVAAAVNITKAIASFQPQLIVQAGIAGIFERTYPLGMLVHVVSEYQADLGAIDPQKGFQDIFDLGIADANDFPYEYKLINNQSITQLPYKIYQEVKQLKPAISCTVNQIMGDTTIIDRIPAESDCHVESMEGAALHYAANSFKIPYFQVRSISNYVEPRNKQNWKMKNAIANLNSWLIKCFN